MTSERPNIVFILADDQGPWALGAAGNHEIRTPNLDRLCASGTRFEHFFCASPVCSPARASLLTGRIPSQHGIHDWLSGGNVGEDATEYLEGITGYTAMLAESGYTCGLSGKWHLGDSIHPQQGFSHWYVHQVGGGSYTDAPMIREGELINQPGYLTDAITDDALAWLDTRPGEDEPFYLGVHYTAPHSPWIGHHPEEIVASYDDCPFETCPEEPLHPWANASSIMPDDGEHRREQLKGYFAAVTAMDLNIGRIIDRIEAMGLRESTLICFMGDNGFNCGHHGFWGKGNGTFPLNMYESSVTVPAIFSQPGRTPQGVVRPDLVSGYDWMPTLLAYLGLANPEADELPGESFLGPLLGHLSVPSRENVVVFDEYGPVRMIRNERWKYIHRYPYGPHELYDLETDPGERTNLIDDPTHLETRRELEAELHAWFLRYVRPEIDGSREPVTGYGQRTLAGTTSDAWAPLPTASTQLPA